MSERYRRATMGTLRVSFLSGSVLELAATLGVALVAVTVGVRLVDGGLGLQAGLTVLVLAPELYAPLRRLGAEFHASAEGAAVAERMFALLDAPPDVGGAAGGSSADARRAPVRFEGVSFAYPARPGLVLDGLDLELGPGETVALVGASGAGKSTVAGLLLRLLEPTAGRITRRRHRSRRVRRRRHGGGSRVGAAASGAACAARSPTTSGSAIRRRVGRATCGRPRRWPAPTRSSRALPDGYGTLVGDGGRPLSAGERRRIALARAFLRDARLVMLDEPTADLDPESAELVADAIERLRAGRTVLLIAHRRELVGRADRVVVLERGGRSPRPERGGMNATLAPAALMLARAPRARLALAVLLGALTVLFGVGLMATAGYLISRAAEQPAILSLTVAIVAVRFFGLARPIARYLERLASHDLALRVLGRVRVRVYGRIEPLAPAQLEGYRQRRPALADGRRRRRAPEPAPARRRAAARRARSPARSRSASRPRSCPPRAGARGRAARRRRGRAAASAGALGRRAAERRRRHAASSRPSWSSCCGPRPSSSSTAAKTNGSPACVRRMPRWCGSRAATPSPAGVGDGLGLLVTGAHGRRRSRSRGDGARCRRARSRADRDACPAGARLVRGVSQPLAAAARELSATLAAAGGCSS